MTNKTTLRRQLRAKQANVLRARGILFSAPMVRALLAGAKTQTRRAVKLREFGPSETKGYEWTFRDKRSLWNDVSTELLMRKFCPYGVPGDRLWVRHRFDLFPVYYKPIPDWEGLYSAGTDGNIYRIDGAEPSPLKASPSEKGYLRVSLSNGAWHTKNVHSLVCAAFYGRPTFDGAQARHVDGDQRNNLPGNLDWGSQQQNWQDRRAHGRGMGLDHHAAKLSPEIAGIIRTSGLSQKKLALEYGVSQSTIHSIISGRTWGRHDVAERNAPAFKPWVSPLFMPRWASRITLEVTEVRVQRLQDISEEDAKAEGPLFAIDQEQTVLFPHLTAERNKGCVACRGDGRGISELCHDSLRGKGRPFACWYATLWDSINGAGSWASNPWVFAISFRRVR